MRIFLKPAVLLAVLILAAGLGACASSGGSTGGSSDIQAITGPVTVTGKYLEFFELVESDPQAFQLQKDHLQDIRQATANPPNLLGNPNFSSNGKGGTYTGNWGSGGWDGKANFTAASPGENPPAPKSLLLPKWSAAITAPFEVMQRVPVEPGAYYYVSTWYYAMSKSMGTLVWMDLNSAGDTYNALGRIFVNSVIYVEAAETWKQLAFIVQIPPEAAKFTDSPHLGFRFRQNRNDITDAYFTKTEIYKLDPDSIKPLGE